MAQAETVDIEVLNVRSKKKLCTFEKIEVNCSIATVKTLFQKKLPKYYKSRQSFRLEQRGKSLQDDEILSDLGSGGELKLYFKDLGPQISWSNVFYCEYAGPLVLYLVFYFRLPLIYSEKYTFSSSRYQVVHLAAACHTFHYAKRLLETCFVHRFSHGTMPIANLFRNSGYYWGFAAWMSYFVNHPLYTLPTYGQQQVYAGLVLFVFCEIGNLSIHLAFKNLRPAGSTKRQIPQPTSNPFTWLFHLVSCPNYTYEAGAWIAFAVMTQSLVALLFASAGFYQMSVWAVKKHRNYRKEFPDYPRSRKSIVPFLL